MAVNPANFKPGQSGNPAGRPKGSRHKLSESFLKALAEDFDQHGVGVLAKVRETDPSTYVRVIAQVLPKEATIDIEHSGSVEHRGLPEIGARVAELLARRADGDSAPLLPH